MPYGGQTLLQIKHIKYSQDLKLSITSRHWTNPCNCTGPQLQDYWRLKAMCFYQSLTYLNEPNPMILCVYKDGNFQHAIVKSTCNSQILKSMISGFWDSVKTHSWWNCYPRYLYCLHLPSPWLRYNFVNTQIVLDQLKCNLPHGQGYALYFNVRMGTDKTIVVVPLS